MKEMEFDPHTLHAILRKIEQQMRCPQCGKKIPVDFASLKMAAKDFVILQLRCQQCSAYIVLHASLKGAAEEAEKEAADASLNASSALSLKDDEVEVLRSALEKSGGSLSALFAKDGDL